MGNTQPVSGGNGGRQPVRRTASHGRIPIPFEEVANGNAPQNQNLAEQLITISPYPDSSSTASRIIPKRPFKRELLQEILLPQGLQDVVDDCACLENVFMLHLTAKIGKKINLKLRLRNDGKAFGIFCSKKDLVKREALISEISRIAQGVRNLLMALEKKCGDNQVLLQESVALLFSFFRRTQVPFLLGFSPKHVQELSTYMLEQDESVQERLEDDFMYLLLPAIPQKYDCLLAAFLQCTPRLENQCNLLCEIPERFSIKCAHQAFLFCFSPENQSVWDFSRDEKSDGALLTQLIRTAIHVIFRETVSRDTFIKNNPAALSCFVLILEHAKQRLKQGAVLQSSDRLLYGLDFDTFFDQRFYHSFEAVKLPQNDTEAGKLCHDLANALLSEPFYNVSMERFIELREEILFLKREKWVQALLDKEHVTLEKAHKAFLQEMQECGIVVSPEYEISFSPSHHLGYLAFSIFFEYARFTFRVQGADAFKRLFAALLHHWGRMASTREGLSEEGAQALRMVRSFAKQIIEYCVLEFTYSEESEQSPEILEMIWTLRDLFCESPLSHSPLWVGRLKLQEFIVKLEAPLGINETGNVD